MAIHQEVTLSGPKELVYSVLTDAGLFAAATGMSATIEPGQGGAFALFDNHVEGRQIELVENERVVQAWRFPSWPKGVYSVVRLTLVGEENATRFILDHDAIPDGVSPLYPSWLEHISTNWAEFYYKPIQKYLEQKHADVRSAQLRATIG